MDHLAASDHSGLVTTVWVGTYVVLAIVGFIASQQMDAAAKRRSMTRGMILVGGLFVVFKTTLVVMESRSWSSLGILIVRVPTVVLGFYLDIKSLKFCDKCGARLDNHNWFTPMRFCSKCGAELGPVKPANRDNLLE